MKIFDTKVQYLKYCALREISRATFNGNLKDVFYQIPKDILPGPNASTRCCIYKERAIFQERLKLAMGGKDNHVVQVLEIACDDCPDSGFNVTESCRGCIAHRCEGACKFGAIKFDNNQKAYIDKSKCKNCGLCAKACQYSAIINNIRPCENACKLKAISMSENKSAKIDYNKCISCGSCVYQCPFGAISDKSFITDVVNMIKDSENNTKYKVHAIVAPSISNQFIHIPLNKLVTGIKEIGFYDVTEVALGADMVADKECKELVEKGFLTSSCCPSFVDYIKKNFPKLVDKISSNLSPMAELGRYIKSVDKKSKVVFIGPCVAKKQEFQKDEVKEYIDSVITFEELQALLDSRDIDVNALNPTELNNASYYGRIFARSGGLKEAISEALLENNITNEDFNYNPISCSGIDECKMALLKANKGVLVNNFIEGMICQGGCIGGPCCITHDLKDNNPITKCKGESSDKTIKEAIKNYVK